MGADTSIQWTDATWNPVRGCSRVSPGCESCYAEGVAARFSGTAVRGGKIVELPYYGLARRSKSGEARWTGEVRMVPEHLADPLRWKKPRRIFVNSMSDLFHEKLTNEQIASVFGVMAAAPRHTFQVLTKRAKRMREWFAWVQSHQVDGTDRVTFTYPVMDGSLIAAPTSPWPLPNVWLGVSAEDQQRLDERWPYLRDTPTAVRFLSVEPQLEQMRLDRVLLACAHWHTKDGRNAVPWEPEDIAKVWWEPQALRGINQKTADWVIVGGESGRAARSFDIAWARLIRDQCKATKTACFIKQLGASPYGGDPAFGGTGPMTLNDGHGGDWDEWPEDLKVRQFPGETGP